MDTLQALSFFSMINSCFLSSSSSPWLVFLTGCEAGLRPPITLSWCTGCGAMMIPLLLRHTLAARLTPCLHLEKWARSVSGRTGVSGEKVWIRWKGGIRWSHCPAPAERRSLDKLLELLRPSPAFFLTGLLWQWPDLLLAFPGKQTQTVQTQVIWWIAKYVSDQHQGKLIKFKANSGQKNKPIKAKIWEEGCWTHPLILKDFFHQIFS